MLRALALSGALLAGWAWGFGLELGWVLLLVMGLGDATCWAREGWLLGLEADWAWVLARGLAAALPPGLGADFGVEVLAGLAGAAFALLLTVANLLRGRAVGLLDESGRAVLVLAGLAGLVRWAGVRVFFKLIHLQHCSFAQARF